MGSGKPDKFDIILAMRIHVLALESLFDTGLSTLLDTFSVANDLARSSPADFSSAGFEVTVIGVRRVVRTSQGLSVPVVSAARSGDPDVAIIPALGSKTPDALQEALQRPDVADAGKLLRLWADRGVLLGAACTGTFVLADSALLDGRSATTSWWLAPLFRKRFPLVALEDSRIVINSGGFVTAGAALAHIDLALWFIRQSSPALAALAARFLLMESRSSQSVFSIPAYLAHADPLVERFEQWARLNLAQGFSLTDAAKAVGTSERTLSRRIRNTMGKTPLAYFQDIRIERAVHFLRTSGESVDAIAARVGYSDGTTLRTLLRHKIGRTVRQLRISS